mmetsp:Transcript_21036/g.68078  ORF Transcript_21036/g.68078 Transcript_21036/m.68078 type:complete len:803 (+) Transcript_21036:69-2477(+)
MMIAYFTIILLQRSVLDSHDVEISIKSLLDSKATYVENDAVPEWLEELVFDEVVNFEDIFEWTTNAFIPLVFPEQEWYNGDPWTEEENNYIGNYNRLVGGFIIAQRRVIPNHAGTCPKNSRFKNFAPTCWPKLMVDGSNLDKAPFGPWYDETRYTYDAASRAHAVEVIVDPEYALRVVEQLRTDRFLDKRTREVEIGFTIYNPNRDIFVYTGILFTQSDAGLIQKTYRTEAFKLDMYSTPEDMFRAFLEVVFTIYVLLSFYGELQELLFGSGLQADTIFGQKKTDEAKLVRPDTTLSNMWENTVEYCSSIWNVIDLARLGMWTTLIAIYCTILSDAEMNNLELPLDREGEIDQRFPNLRPLAEKWKLYTIVNSSCIFVCLLSLFKYLNKSREYGIIVRTISQAGPTLGKYLIVVALCYINYIVMGMILFGHILPEFRTFATSAETLCMMVSGELGYELVRNSASTHGTAIFYFSFLILMFIIMLNILLAIVMDAYASLVQEIAEIKENTYASQNFSLGLEIYLVWYRKSPSWVKSLLIKMISKGMSRRMLSSFSIDDAMSVLESIELKNVAEEYQPDPTVADPTPPVDYSVTMDALCEVMPPTAARSIMLQLGKSKLSKEEELDMINNVNTEILQSLSMAGRSALEAILKPPSKAKQAEKLAGEIAELQTEQDERTKELQSMTTKLQRLLGDVASEEKKREEEEDAKSPKARWRRSISNGNGASALAAAVTDDRVDAPTSDAEDDFFDAPARNQASAPAPAPAAPAVDQVFAQFGNNIANLFSGNATQPPQANAGGDFGNRL